MHPPPPASSEGSSIHAAWVSGVVVYGWTTAVVIAVVERVFARFLQRLVRSSAGPTVAVRT
jgi:hypothetical protein